MCMIGISMFVFREQKLSRDQLQIILGRLQSKLDTVDATIKHVKSTGNTAKVTANVNTLNGTFNTAKTTAKTGIENYIGNMYKCMMEASGSGTDCKAFSKSSDAAVASLLKESHAYTRREIFSYFVDGGYISSLESEASHLKDEISRIQALLVDASSSIDGLSSHISVANITDEYKSDQWLQFKYDSTSSSSSQESSHSFSTSSSGGGFGGFFFGSSGSSYSRSEEQAHENKLAKCNMTVKGELLRVNIKRPWFKPEIFDEPGLTYVSI